MVFTYGAGQRGPGAGSPSPGEVITVLVTLIRLTVAVSLPRPVGTPVSGVELVLATPVPRIEAWLPVALSPYLKTPTAWISSALAPRLLRLSSWKVRFTSALGWPAVKLPNGRVSTYIVSPAREPLGAWTNCATPLELSTFGSIAPTWPPLVVSVIVWTLTAVPR